MDIFLEDLRQINPHSSGERKENVFAVGHAGEEDFMKERLEKRALSYRAKMVNDGLLRFGDR